MRRGAAVASKLEQMEQTRPPVLALEASDPCNVLFVCVQALRVAMTGHDSRVQSRRPGRGGVRGWGHAPCAQMRSVAPSTGAS